MKSIPIKLAPIRSTTSLRILLIQMPIANPTLPNLAIELLAQIARNASHHADVLYGTLLMPPVMSFEHQQGMVGQAAFAPDYFGLDEDIYAQELVELIEGKPVEANDTRCADGHVDFLLSFDAARECLDRCIEKIPVGSYDLVGFSVGFDAQKIPSVALAKRLKQHDPNVKILFGGTGCDGDMAAAMLERFTEVDAVLRGEGDALFLSALTAVTSENDQHLVPQLVWRSEKEGIVVNEDMAAFNQMNELPDPDYASFLKQKQASAYQNDDLTLMFEGSRGCWWGDKHHCKFCGIRAVQLGFRTRKAENVLRSIRRLDDYGASTIYATDAILDLKHLRNLMPVLAHERRATKPEWELFYEIKSNAKRADFALLAAAGVRKVQPGIESFSTAALKRVDKGATGLQQIQALKWCATYGIRVIYGLLVGIPGDSADELRRMVAKMKVLHHLFPPAAANSLALHSFSPYAKNPDQYGIEKIQPFNLQRAIYRADDELTAKLCYELQFSIEAQQDSDYLSARDEIVREVALWQANYAAGQKLILQGNKSDSLLLRFSPIGTITPTIIKLGRKKTSVLYACENIASLKSIVARTGLPEKDVLSNLNDFEQDGVVLREGNKWLCLAVPGGVDAWSDAGLPSTSQSKAEHGEAIAM